MENTDFKELLKSSFHTAEAGMNGESKSEFHQVRKASLEEFLSLRVPTVKDEEWKYTNITPITGKRFTTEVPVTAVGISELQKIFFNIDAYLNIVFVNGRLNHELSGDLTSLKGVTISTIRDAFAEKNPAAETYYNKTADLKGNIFAALNTSFVAEGLFIHVEKNVTAEKPVRIIYVQKNAENLLVSPRNLIVAEKGSQLDLIETYTGLDETSSLTNAVTEVYTSENAYVSHIIVQEENLNSYYINNVEVTQEGNSNYESLNIALGSAIGRTNMSTRFTGQNSEATLNGLFIADGSQLIDNHTMIDHAMPHCRSHELYKGVLGGKSRGVFNGKVMVRQDAQKTNAFQENKTILLSEDALIDTKPQLEIFADDVKCTHGATVGQLSEESLFYLKTRGIGDQLARSILINAFADDLVNRMKFEDLRDYLEAKISARLA
ncbi:MAG: Fe-S cluster assembly protein SufD [Ignavibacteriales bacterium]